MQLQGYMQPSIAFLVFSMFLQLPTYVGFHEAQWSMTNGQHLAQAPSPLREAAHDSINPAEEQP